MFARLFVQTGYQDLPAIAGAEPAVDDALTEVVAEVVVVSRPCVEEQVPVNVVVHAQLGTGDHAILDTPAGDITNMRTDEGMPGAGVPHMAETRYPSGAPTVLGAGADGVEQYTIRKNLPVGRQRIAESEFRAEEIGRE